MQKLRNISFFVAVLFCFAVSAHAQSATGQLQTVNFTVSPEVPGPTEAVVITAQGVGGFLGDAMITWQRDGKTILSGVGERSLSFTTGGTGVSTKIHVTIHSSSQGDFSKDFVFVPSNVHLVWEAHTSVPPLYRGKALYSVGSQIKLIALAQVASNGSFIAPSRLSYQWQVGDEPVVSASGVGRSTFTYYGNQLKQNEQVSLGVFYGGIQVGSASVTIPAVNPGILFYVKDPLRGLLLDQALPPTISLSGKELTLYAQPFSFATQSLGKTITYTWMLNGQEITNTSGNNGILTLRQSGSGQGESVVSLELQNTDTYKFLQTAEAQLRIVFGLQTSSTGAFGI